MSTLNIALLDKLLPPNGDLYLAYSGGVDSHVLLHLCAQRSAYKHRLRAVYVDHGLQADSRAWGEHCSEQCRQLGVDFQMLHVDAQPQLGESPEAAARSARYRVLRPLLVAGDVLLLAQHREDQMETFLLQLFRGAGVQGLAAMPAAAPFGRGQMLRPLLSVAKQDILDYAVRHDLHWVDDPSNQSSDYDRNFLRNQILPQLKQRWPSLDKTIARSAQHCADAFQLLDESAGQWLQSIITDDNALMIPALMAHSPSQQRLLLRYWLEHQGLLPPSETQLHHIINQVILAKADANPLLQLQQHSIRRYRQRLYCLHNQHLQLDESVLPWLYPEQPLMLANGYVLTAQHAVDGIDPALWRASEITVGYRQGGETIALPGREGRHCLKKLYQEAGIAPWQRQIRPLIYLDDRLAAVADLWIADWAWSAEGGIRLQWQPAQETT